MKIKNLIYPLFVFFAICLFSSCDKDKIITVGNVEKPSDNANVKISYSALWTKDLLEFVTPMITYTDISGKHEVVTPNADCEYNEPVYTIDGETFKGTPYYYWNRDVLLECVPVDNVITVTFVRNKDNVVDNEKTYRFIHHLNVHSVIAVNGTQSTSEKFTTININIGGDSDLYKGQAAEVYLDELCKKQDKIKISIDNNLNITKE